MHSSDERYVEAAGVRMRVLEAGAGAPVVLLHGGTAGSTHYAGAARIWSPLIEELALTHRVLALDLPGSGGTRARELADLTVEGMTRLVAAALEALSLREMHLLAHAESALVALRLTREGFPGGAVRSCTIVAGHQVTPTGDGVENLTLLNPPQTGRQGWAVDRLSYGASHIGRQLLAELDEAWNGEAHQGALGLLAVPGAAGLRTAEIARAKAELHGYCREVGYDVPIALVWGADDPTTSIAHAYELMRFLSTTRAHLSLHLMNQVGHFPFREAPQELARLVRPLLSTPPTSDNSAIRAAARGDDHRDEADQ
jgi:pimeloyl-ACP methyl ester carboxylesterase